MTNWNFLFSFKIVMTKGNLPLNCNCDTIFVQPGQPLDLHCFDCHSIESSGNLTWTFLSERKPLYATKFYNSSFFIQSATSENSGDYKCQLKLPNGSIKSSERRVAVCGKKLFFMDNK